MGANSRRQRRPRRTGAWLGVGVTALVACAQPEPDTGPRGAWWAGESATVHRLLDQLGQLQGTPLARRASEWADSLPDCERVGAHAPDGSLDVLADSAHCLEAGEPVAAALDKSGAELAFALPVRDDGPPLRGALRGGAGVLSLTLHWSHPTADGALELLLPGDEPVGPDLMSRAGRLFHLRVRPRDGIDLASLVPADSQADRLFALRNQALAQAVLDGTWESAAYLPERPGGMPGLALAVGFRLRSAAESAAEQFVAELQKTWPVRRVPHELAGARGACLPDLNLLPEMAPCYAVTDSALVVGWDARSLERALAGDASRAPEAAGRLDVDLGLLGRADALLHRQLGLSEEISALRWPWRRVLATAATLDDVLEVKLTLVLDPESAS